MTYLNPVWTEAQPGRDTTALAAPRSDALISHSTHRVTSLPDILSSVVVPVDQAVGHLPHRLYLLLLGDYGAREVVVLPTQGLHGVERVAEVVLRCDHLLRDGCNRAWGEHLVCASVHDKEYTAGGGFHFKKFFSTWKLWYSKRLLLANCSFLMNFMGRHFL